ncbi:MAG TPA: thiol-disulfide isomerase [Candidatus Eisenbacteria bacterium]|nr:thiol-disulfide isomerase [Candidatus Eisenbacteria bacterium]
MKRQRAMALGCGLLAMALPVAGRQATSAQQIFADTPQASATTRANELTFYRDVLPVLQGHCQVCHRVGGIAPMALQTYAEARPYAAAIRTAVENRSMPPWFAEKGIGHFANDPSLSDAQIARLAAWAAAGAPAGNPEDAPPPRKWAERWTIPEPDDVVAMPEAVEIPASGDVDYTYEIVPTHFKEDRWVRASEILPGLPEHVHHAVVYVRPPDSPWLRHAPVEKPFTAATLPDAQGQRDAMWTTSDILLVYAPGSTPDNWPAGMAKLVPAGSDLVFQMHYTTNGKVGHDRTRIGLIFAQQPPQKRVLTLQLTNDRFVIPPGDPDYRVEVHGTLPNDALLLNFFPHMHLRGKQFEYNILRPDGTVKTTLLRVHYHFHWQMSYRLAEPLLLKAGTRLQAVAWFDNSGDNPHNPDPTAAVRWGEQTYDEMMVGFFDVAVDPGFDKQRFFQRKHPPKPVK